MSDLLTAADIEERARKIGLPMKVICMKARINQSTFWRWKNGELNPSIDVYRRLCEATDPEGYE